MLDTRWPGPNAITLISQIHPPMISSSPVELNSGRAYPRSVASFANEVSTSICATAEKRQASFKCASGKAKSSMAASFRSCRDAAMIAHILARRRALAGAGGNHLAEHDQPAP